MRRGKWRLSIYMCFPRISAITALKKILMWKRRLLQVSGIQHASDCLAKELVGGQLCVLRTQFCNSCEPVIAPKSQELLAAGKFP